MITRISVGRSGQELNACATEVWLGESCVVCEQNASVEATIHHIFLSSSSFLFPLISIHNMCVCGWTERRERERERS